MCLRQLLEALVVDPRAPVTIDLELGKEHTVRSGVQIKLCAQLQSFPKHIKVRVKPTRSSRR